MTYQEIMAQWKGINRRMWPFFIMPLVSLFAFREFASIGGVVGGLAWAGLVIHAYLASKVYGELADELEAVSALADEIKMSRLEEDLARHGVDMSLIRVVSNQELGNFRFPSRLMFTVKDVGHLVAYDWDKRRFGRYKWPILPYSIDKVVARAKPQT